MKNRIAIALILACACLSLALAQSVKPPGVEIPSERQMGTVPDYFMLNMTAPGCDPGEDCDDVGPKQVYRNWYLDQTGCNVGSCGISWRECEKVDPGEGEPVYDFSSIELAERDRRMKFKIGRIHSGGARWVTHPGEGMGPAWVEKDEFKFETKDGKKVVSERYWRRYEHFVEAACRYAREELGVTIFSTGGNERDLVAWDTYKDYYPGWQFYYMDPVKHVHAAMKRAHPDNQLIIGSMCYTDGPHVEALYQAGAKGNFEILAIHNYGKKGVHLDMFQIIEGHKEMARHGDGHIGMMLTEGWSCFPLPEYIDRDPRNRQEGGRVYTSEDAEHYRQTVSDGWRNIMTPRSGEYDPKWVIGANYFVLNDHWGGLGWEKRGVAVYEENGKRHEIPATQYHGQGKIKAFKLDGYEIGTGDPLWIKPFLRPWGLIDIHGKPKGDTIFNFPPYLPKHDFVAQFDVPTPDKEISAGFEYPVTVVFTNRERSPMTDFRMKMIGRDDPANQVRYRKVGGDETDVIAAGQTVTRKYMVMYPAGLIDGDPYRARGFADAHYTWKGRPYHTDAWMPKVKITQPFSLSIGPGKRTVLNPTEEAIFSVVVGSSHKTSFKVPVWVHEPPSELEITPQKIVLEAQSPGAILGAFVAKLKDSTKPGIYQIKMRSLEGIEELIVPVSFSWGGASEPEGFGLRNASFEAYGADSGYAFWEGEMTNWVETEKIKSLPGSGERVFGAMTDWRTFDYTIWQTLDLAGDAAGKKVKASVWFIGWGWEAGASEKDVQGFINLEFLDGEGEVLHRNDGPKELGIAEWREISLLSDAVPEEARKVRLELRLLSDTDEKGCRRGAMDMARLELVP